MVTVTVGTTQVDVRVLQARAIAQRFYATLDRDQRIVAEMLCARLLDLTIHEAVIDALVFRDAGKTFSAGLRCGQLTVIGKAARGEVPGPRDVDELCDMAEVMMRDWAKSRSENAQEPAPW